MFCTERRPPVRTIQRFEECFEGFVSGKPEKEILLAVGMDGNCAAYLSGYVNLSLKDGFQYGYAQPAQWIVEVARTQMIHIGNDRMYCQIVQTTSGTFDLYLKYSQILGQRLLCEITPDSMPTFPSDEE